MKQKLLLLLMVAWLPMIAFCRVSIVQSDGIWYSLDDIAQIAKVLVPQDGKGYSGDRKIPDFIETGYPVILYPVTAIEESAFKDCKELTSLIIGNRVETIEMAAFEGCNNLEAITIGSSVNYIGQDAFEGCEKLTYVEITDLASWCNIHVEVRLFLDRPASISNPLYYSHHLFHKGGKVSDLVIPDGVTSISSYAFTGCYSLHSVTIPNSVTSINDDAFSDCI